ncbi:MAG: DEAD/DEAH box helicase [Deltaproteobacteria bacterium]|nr:DEAD/DEAH box helicase [Deltaproteobacteria bacterium]MBW2120929.1 DEAD/DEAH box helicase [Deltaproteobacteria bacterium]
MDDREPGHGERSLESILDWWRRSKDISPCITRVEHIPARRGIYADFPPFIHGELVSVLKKRGISRLYSHQKEALEAVRSGKDVVVVTPTASGKTLCYNLPVLNDKMENPPSRSLYLFPTKALAQDQMAEVEEFQGGISRRLKVHTYDGDTPGEVRRAIRSQADIVITNPDMLHTGILPHHTKWASFFQNLRYVVIDELHFYRGVLGSHMANVIRRMDRVSAFYGSRPQFICCSATIANPKDLAERLIERRVELIARNGAPSGEKTFVFFNPPVVNKELGIRANHLKAAERLASALLKEKVQTILFVTSRLNVEVLTKYLKDRVGRSTGREQSIRGYRGGYLPRTRREIERGLREGRVLAVVSTNALELGIDIGWLNACMIVGYPGTIASTWQQAGRAGRRSGRALVVFVARSSPLDQFIIEHPDYFFGGSPEYGRVNPDNLLIMLSHIKCAAFELPFREGERFGGEDLDEILEFLADKEVLHKSGGRWHWTQDAYPADEVSLRSISEENFVVVDTTREKGKPANRVIAEVDFVGAHTTLYPEAVYMCESQLYQVERLDYHHRKAYVRRFHGDHYTEALSYTHIAILDTFEGSEEGSYRVEHGEIRLTSKVVGFKKIRFHTLENLGYGKVSLPDQEMHTTACWFTFRKAAIDSFSLPRWEVIDGVLGISHALHAVACLHLMCDPRDIQWTVGDREGRWFVRLSGEGRGLYGSVGGEDLVSPETVEEFEPTVYIYESYPGGVGFSHQIYDTREGLFRETLGLISRCPCSHGCPSCVGPTKEVGMNSKEVAMALLSHVLDSTGV